MNNFKKEKGQALPKSSWVLVGRYWDSIHTKAGEKSASTPYLCITLLSQICPKPGHMGISKISTSLNALLPPYQRDAYPR